MNAALLNALLVVATASCQQADRREAAGDVVATLPAHAAPIATNDAAVREAEAELDAGHPWLATRRLAPRVAAKSRAPSRPDAVLVAARAAAAWGGWSEVQRLLTGQPWLSDQYRGEGLELLARAALEVDSATAARTNAESALRIASDPASRAIRLTVLARALDRLNVFDSAAATYARAADALPGVRDWLLLRQAGVTVAAPAREKLFADVHDAIARERIAWTEAQALERFGQLEDAALAYEKLDDQASAFRLRLAATRDDAKRAQLRGQLLDYIRRARGDDLRRAIDVLDAAFPTLDAPMQLVVSRRAAAMTVSARAASGFAAVPATSLTDADVIGWANALIATGRSSDAAARLGAHRFAPAWAAQAGFLRGRALLRAGSGAAARTALLAVVKNDAASPYAADAQYLLGDVSADAGDDRAARDWYQRSCAHAPVGAYSDDACFRAGIVSLALGDARGAATTLDDALKRFPNSSERQAILYWSGRAWTAAGNATTARDRWRSVAGMSPLSYYASASARRLGGVPWEPVARPLPRSPHVEAALTRAASLELLGMDAEQRFELDALDDQAAASTGAALATGAALLRHDEASRAIRLGRTVVAAGTPDSLRDARGYMLLYPLLHRDEVVAFAKANHLDAALVAAVIRQESGWYPRAVSVAGARGLMQLMPPVGEQIARARGYPVWDPTLLFDPDVNLELGTAHLRASLAEETSPTRALAAYNAGASRVARWSRRTGAADPELFIERIPFVETRDYVRIVLRNAEIYRALYGL